MKRLFRKKCWLLFLLSLLCLTGCGKQQTAHTTPPETTEATAESENGVPYLLRIGRADQSIFAGPGYDYVFLGTVQEQGVYTIVEESRDYEGNLWGKLKSGAGWVDLSEIRSPEYANALISANYAEEKLILQGDYHSYPGTGQGYEIPVAFRAYGRLRDVVLFPFELTETGLTAGQAIFAMDEWNGDMPLVAQLAFPGDMTTYGICFVDEAGIPHIYSIYISGRNGSLVLSRYEE